MTAEGKVWYNLYMEHIEETTLVNERIAKNLVHYRKLAGFTQAELAQKLNYSDKSISKWESANGVPDVYVLLKLADLYGVTVHDLVGEDSNTKSLPHHSSKVNTSLIMLLSSGLVWLVAIVFFAMMKLFTPHQAWWLTFLYALPVTALVVVILSAVFHRRTTNFLSIASLVWTGITCVYVSFQVLSPGSRMARGIWAIFLVGAVFQALQIVWTIFRITRRRAKEQKMRFEKADTSKK